jgi:hypothetical protein
MRFNPKTEEEVQSMNLLEPGTYQFQVIDASNEKSKSGNDMIKLTLNVWGKDGSSHHIYDYLLEALAYKLRHFCSNTGLISRYERGELTAEDCLGKEGAVKIEIQEGKLKENGERYPSNNKVKDYIKSGEGFSTTASMKQFENEDVPF